MHRAMNANRADDRDDRFVIRPDPFAAHRDGINQAIQQREQAILAEAKAQQQARTQARQAAVSKSRAADAERRIFNQVAAVGGIRRGRS